MKVFRSILPLLAVFVVFLSCQKELWFDGVSSGTLDCPSVTVNGIFKKDSVLNNANFVDVQVNISIPGTYDISSDTINGYSFSGKGTVIAGTNAIRLFAYGKPIAAGINRFTIKYGTNSCSFDITVKTIGAALFTLSGAPNGCTGAIADGTYTVGIALDPSNTITVQVNVTSPGTYVINAGSSNGFQFTGNGIFTTTGSQAVTLTGTGVPITAGISTVTVTNIVSSCTFNITVSPPLGLAVFSFDGTPNTCTNFTVNGTYTSGIATTATNTVIVDVNVTTPGTYTINTNTANGVIFSKTGIFLSTGHQTVTLSASGIPIDSGAWYFIPNTGTTASCTFSITVQPPLLPAIYTFNGISGACTPATVYGNYAVLIPLNPANTVAIQVNVSSTGTYTFSTNTVNGMTFSATGVFTLTGLQTVTIRGSGIPQTSGPTIFTLQNAISTCTFNVQVQ